jgi:hypothetical protein
MRVRFQESGGIAFFPGLAAPKTIEVEALPDGDRRTLRELVEAAAFFSLPPRMLAASSGAADVRTYQITIEDGERRHTVAVSDPVTDPTLQQLIEKLRSLARP